MESDTWRCDSGHGSQVDNEGTEAWIEPGVFLGGYIQGLYEDDLKWEICDGSQYCECVSD